MNILGIDDNEDILKLLNTVITSKGHNFTQALNGKDGVKLIEEQNFDAILLDLAMPEFTGYDVIKTLEERNLLDKQKILVLSASEIPKEESEKLYKKNITILRKPVQLPELLESLTSE